MSKIKKIICLLIMGAVFIGSFGTATINANEINSQEINNQNNRYYRAKILTTYNIDGSVTYTITEQELRKELKSQGYTDEQLGMLGLERWGAAGISVRVFGNWRKGDFDAHITQQTARVLTIGDIAMHLVDIFLDVYKCRYFRALGQCGDAIGKIAKLNRTKATTVYVRHWRIVKVRH